MQLRSVAFALIAAASFGCVPPLFVPGEPGGDGAAGGRRGPSASGPREGARPTVTLSDARLRSEILAEVNLARRAAAVPELVENGALAAAASDYSVELARKRRLTHESDTPDRRTLGDRLGAAGAEAWIAAGENLAMVHSSDARLVETTVQGWLDSPGHRRNLLDPAYALAGTGVARAADGYWYITQVYVRPAQRTSR